MTALSEAAMRWFIDRGVDPETATRCGVYTTKPGEDGEAIVFPFIEAGESVNEKYRGRGKKFWQRQGGRKTFWNADVLTDPTLREDRGGRLIITEGEMDALTAIDSGFPLTVSVPDGAPAKPAEHEPDPTDDAKFEYVWNNWDQLKDIKRIVLATDNDAPGKALAGELVRRLGVERCLWVEYPDDCKDLNEVLLKHGQSAVATCLNMARPYPVQGLYSLSEYPDIPQPESYSTGWDNLDKFCKIQPGALIVVTGLPGHGKSSFTNALSSNLVRQHGWHICVASFEQPPVPYHRDNLRQNYVGRPVDRMSPGEKFEADQWIERNFRFIAQNPVDDDQDFDLEQILDLAAVAVVRHGTRCVILDPWNEIEHKRRPGETESDYIGRALRMLTRFSKRYEVTTIIVAHPNKMGGGRDGVHKPTLYDIAGSANWANKPDAGIVVWRENIHDPVVEIDVKKMRFRSAGRPGTAEMKFDESTNRFAEWPPPEFEGM